MSFNHPEFLFALFALLVPVIIHLFNFRRYKKVLFSNVEFLKNIKSETRKQNELKHLLVLLFRLLAIAFIVFAFAGPQFSSDKKNRETSGQVTKVIYLDNSFSMSAQDDNTRLLDIAIENARNLVELSPADTRFVLMTNTANSGKRILSREDVLTELEQLRLGSSSRSFSNLLRTEQKFSIGNKLTNRDIYLFSDFQKSSIEFNELEFDTASFYYFLPLEQTQKRNIYLDSCKITSPVLIPGKRIELMISLKNGSDMNYEKIPLKVTIDGKQKGVAGVDLKAGQEEIVPVTFIAGESGWHKGVISIEDSPVTFDNLLYFTFRVKEKIRIIELNNGQASSSLKKFYESDSVFSFSEKNYRQVDINSMQEADLVILNGVPDFSNGFIKQLTEYTNNGGNLFFFPDGNASSIGNNDFLKAFRAGEFTFLDKEKTKVSRINQQDDLFKDAIEKIPENADFPSVNEHYRIKYSTNSEISPLVTFLNGDDFLVKKRTENGTLFVLTVPLGKEYSNFSTHPLFIPVMYGSSFSNKSSSKLFYTIGVDNSLNTNISSANSVEVPFQINNVNSEFSFIPVQQFISGNLNIDIHDNIEEDGIYGLTLNDSLFALYGFNYNRNESKMDFFTENDITTELEKLGITNFKIVKSNVGNDIGIATVVQKESELWKLFIILALLMLMAEIIVLRYWK